MRIDDLIKRLQELRDEFGNKYVEILIFDSESNFPEIVKDVDFVHYYDSVVLYSE